MMIDNKCFSCPDFNLLSSYCKLTVCIRTLGDMVIIPETIEHMKSYSCNEKDPDYGIGKWS